MLAVDVVISLHDADLAVYERVATGIVDANVEVWYAQLTEAIGLGFRLSQTRY